MPVHLQWRPAPPILLAVYTGVLTDDEYHAMCNERRRMLWITKLDFIQYDRGVFGQELNVEQGLIEKTSEGTTEATKISHAMIVANRIACLSPDMLLRVKIGTSGREVQQLQARFLVQ